MAKGDTESAAIVVPADTAGRPHAERQERQRERVEEVRTRDGETFAAYVNRLSDKELHEFSRKPVFEGLPPPPAIIAEPRVSA